MTGTTASSDFTAAFRPRARLLQLLGDQLIASPRLAVFELVKNAYDADADQVLVRMEHLGTSKARIVISDNGNGMTEEVIRNAWLVPADDHKERARLEGRRTGRKRLPVGEKGLGRFAVHKLGDAVRLTTRSSGTREYVVEIDWRSLTAARFLDEATVSVRRREPVVFTGRKTGTLIEVSSLREQDWSRGEIRRLYRQVMAFCSPFDGPADFRVRMEVPGHEELIDDIPDTAELMETALWSFDFTFDRGAFDWDFRFGGLAKLKLEAREIHKHGESLIVPVLEPSRATVRRNTEIAGPALTEGIGPVRGSFRIFDRDKEVLALFPERQLLREFLDENGGVRVYRDGVRIHDYGEHDDDWLGLDLRRVNRPTRNLSRNIVVGEVSLDLAHSKELVEKTNREGFVANRAYANLRRIVLGALTVLEAERQKDKTKIRQRTGGGGSKEETGINRHLEQLRQKSRSLGVLPNLQPAIDQIEKDYRDMRDTLLQAGMSGMGLALVFHEIERGIRTAHDSLERGGSPQIAIQQLSDIRRVLNDFSTLLRNEAAGSHELRGVVRQSIAINRIRFQRHHIVLEGPFTTDGAPDTQAVFSRKLVLGTLTNLIDNAIYWIDVRWPDDATARSPRRRKIWLGTGEHLGAPAIVIADTGPGFQDDPEDLIAPFFTRRPDGMGLGLYYANMAMDLSGGRLIFPQRGDVSIPGEFDGAVIALVFDRKS